MRRWAALIVVLVASAVAPASPTPPSVSRIERTPETVQRINNAIDRGVLYLKKSQKIDGSFAEFPGFPGATTALAYVTLRVCGLKRDDAACRNAWASLRRDYDRNGLKTYAAAVYLMAIAEHGDRASDAPDEHDVKLSKDEAKWAEEMVRILVSGQDGDGCWNYDASHTSAAGREGVPGEYDHSNTQYALLGLKAAARCGVVVPSSVWKRSLEHFIATQEATGPEVERYTGPVRRGSTNARIRDHARGWCYRGLPTPPGATNAGGSGLPQPPNTSMTAGGVSSVVICRSELIGRPDMTAKLDVNSERAAWDGLAWIGANWVPDYVLAPGPGLDPRWVNAMGTGLSLYEYYGVERAGVLAGVEWMANRDWYGEGAKSLCSTQMIDGEWKGIDLGLMDEDVAARKASFRAIDSCFALLFLKRGTIPVRRGAVTQGGGDSDINFDTAGTLTGKDLEDFLDLVFARWRRTEDDEVKQRLFDGATSAGPRIVEPLLLRMDAPDAARRAAAHALLAHATGLDFGYVAEGSAAARDAAVVKWQMWWMAAKGRCAYDPTLRRIVSR